MYAQPLREWLGRLWRGPRLTGAGRRAFLTAGVCATAVGVAEASRIGLILKGGRLLASPPSNTVAPAITGTTTEGQALTSSTGTWTNSPTGYAYQWKRDGSNISSATASTYTLVTADVGATITCTVTASNGGGSNSATATGVGPIIAAGTKALAATSISIGQWTKAGRGHVPLANIMVPAGNDVPVSWTVGTATSGTDGHWTKISAGTTQASGNAYTPYPSTSGDTAELSSGTYVFPVTATYADASTDTKNLTITIVADAASMGHYDTFDKANIIGAGTIAAWEAQNANAKSLLISTGVNHSGVRNGGVGSFLFSSQVRIRHADPTRPSAFTVWECSNCTFCKFEGIVLTGNANGLGTNGLWHISGGFADCVFDDCGVNMGSYANKSASAYALQLFGTNSRLTFNRFRALWMQGGIQDQPSAVNTDITFNNCYLRYFYDNAVFISNIINWTFNDLITASPMRSPHGAAHVDHFQMQDDLKTERVNNLVINRYLCIDMDGDAYSGGLFGLRGYFTINGYAYLGRGNQSYTFGGLEAGASTAKNATAIKGYGQTFYDNPPNNIDDYCCTTGDPRLLIYGSTTHDQDAWAAGTLVMSKSIIQSQTAYSSATIGGVPYTGVQPSTLTLASSFHVLGVESQAANAAMTTYFDVDPRTPYDAVTTSAWAAMDDVAAIAFAKSILTPKTGVTDGAFADTGAWNT